MVEELYDFMDMPIDNRELFMSLSERVWQEYHANLRVFVRNRVATVRLRTAKTRGCVARHTILSMVYKFGQSAQKKWRRLRGFKLLADVIRGVQFKDGESVDLVKEGELNRAVV